MAENAAGSVDALMRAFGYTDSAQFRKRIEQGGLQLTPDKAKAFAKELSKVANSNGALGAVTQKTNAQMQRFFNTLTEAKDNIFQNGMGQGLSQMFSDLSIVLKDMSPLFKAIGGAFKGFVSTLSLGLRFIMAPIGLVVDLIKGLWSALGVGDKGTQFFWAVAGAGGTIVLLATRFKLVETVLKAMNIQLLIGLRRLALYLAPLMAIEDVYSTLKGRKTITSTAIEGALSTPQGRQSAADFMSTLKTTGSTQMALANLAMGTVLIEVKDSEFGKAISASFDKFTGQTSSVTQAETAQ